jgi:hypothetical protein
MERLERRQRRIRRADLRRYVRSASKRRNRGKVMAVIYASGVGTVSAGPVIIDGIGTLAHDLAVLAASDAQNGVYRARFKEELTQAQRDAKLECPVCGVRGVWSKCFTRSGNTAAKPHKGRFDGQE